MVAARLERARRPVGLVAQGAMLEDALVKARQGRRSPNGGDQAQARFSVAYTPSVKFPARITELGRRGALGPPGR
jgi:hypothetical protein